MALISTILAIALIVGCRETAVYMLENSRWVATKGENPNFTLYVSNQSFEIKRADIKITVDGATAIDEHFAVSSRRSPPRHHWKKYLFSLSEGAHVLEIESVIGQARLRTEFEVTNTHWAVVEYRDENRLRFCVYDNPIGFL
jgi:hypothetical protein